MLPFIAKTYPLSSYSRTLLVLKRHLQLQQKYELPDVRLL